MPKKKPTAKLQPKNIFHIYCEGKKTEPNYLNGYIQLKFPSNQGRKLVLVEKTNKNTPVQLVEEAVAAKKDPNNLSSDEFWVVYDREAPSKYSDELHANARNTAATNGVKVALSNVCFELRILLHFQSCTASYGSCADLLKNSALKTHLKNIGIDNYEKSDAALFQKIAINIATAKLNAEAMNQQSLKTAPSKVTQPHLINPYTEVHLLLDAMDKFKQ